MLRSPKLLFTVALFFISRSVIICQVLPKEGSRLNYRIIGFFAPYEKQLSNYQLEIATGYCTTNDSFKSNIIKTNKSKTNKIIEEVPSFGSNYTWRTGSFSGTNRSNIIYGPLHHFSTGEIPNVDTNAFRLRIIQPAQKYKDAYVFLDATKTLYDMNGQPVWYLPTSEDAKKEPAMIRDIKPTAQKTITYEIDKRGTYEINYNGTVLWKKTDADKEHYHHELTRLNNGHYMVLGQEFRFWKQPSSIEDSSLVIISKDKLKPGETSRGYTTAEMGTIIEYDKKGIVVWRWKTSDHFNGSSMLYHNNGGKAMQRQSHENSFFFDERSKAIYLSCRDINRIIKIKYPEGNILAIYGGDADKPGGLKMGSGFFCGQHSCKRSADGYLYLYNNNACNPGAVPSIVVMKEPATEKDSLKMVWEYACAVDSSCLKKGYTTGGNVIELPDSSFLVSMAYASSNVFIVNRAKEILWNAIAEKWNVDEKKWEHMNLYRASIIPSRKELEKFIWNGTDKLK